jgi:uncharacterized protein YndB with AHSA1/START domain
MTALADIQIRKSVAAVWDTLLDAATHPHWLGPGHITQYSGEVTAGCRFRRTDPSDGVTREGEILSMRVGQFLKARLDFPDDRFELVEYHLFQDESGCRVRIVAEAVDTGELHRGYIVEVIDQHLSQTLMRLKTYCEAA